MASTVENTKSEPRTLAEGGHDRLITVVRGAAMVIVVLAHTGFSVVKQNGRGITMVSDGVFIDLVSWSVAWVAAFFATGGAVSRRSGKTPIVQWWARRAPRLLMPYWFFAVIMVPIQFLLAATNPMGVCQNFGIKHALAWIVPPPPDCLGLVNIALWFLFIYIPIALFAPWLVKVYDSRFRWIAPVAALCILIVLDLGNATGAIGAAAIPSVVSLGTPHGILSLFHLFLFWSLCFYVGFIYADGYVARLGKWLLPAAIGLAALTAAMILVGPWPENVFGTWARGGNQFPPTLAWFFGFLAGSFFLIWLRKPIEAFSDRKVPEKIFDWLANNSLSILIWHMVPATILYWAARSAGILPELDGLPVALVQAVWFCLSFLMLIPVVNLVAPVEALSDRVGKDLEARVKHRRRLGPQP